MGRHQPQRIAAAVAVPRPESSLRKQARHRGTRTYAPQNHTRCSFNKDALPSRSSGRPSQPECRTCSAPHTLFEKARIQHVCGRVELPILRTMSFIMRDSEGTIELEIRRAVLEDVPSIAHVHVASWREARKGPVFHFVTAQSVAVEMRETAFWRASMRMRSAKRAGQGRGRVHRSDRRERARFASACIDFRQRCGLSAARRPEAQRAGKRLRCRTRCGAACASDPGCQRSAVLESRRWSRYRYRRGLSNKPNDLAPGYAEQ